MATVILELPGTLTDTSGLRRVITTTDGFPNDLLEHLYLFEDGSGTAAADSVVGGGAASIQDSGANSNTGSAWLATGAGGGLRIQGSKQVAIPARDVRTPWTIVLAGNMVGSVGDTTSAKNYQFISFLTSSASNVRGAFLYLAGGTNWNSSPTNVYDIRVANGSGGVSAAVALAPGNTTVAIGTGRVKVLSYNGTDTISAAVYDKNGLLLQSGTAAATDTLLTTGASAVVQNTLQPILGPFNSAVYSGGNQNIEAAAVYGRLLSADDIAIICAASAELADARGRTWS